MQLREPLLNMVKYWILLLIKMKIIVTIILVVFCLQLIAQDNYSITNIKLFYDKVSEEININYDLLPANSNAQFKIVPEFYYSNGQKIFASAYTGEGIETFTNCGNSKIIRWKPKQDNVKGINENIYVVLNVKREIKISTGSHLLKSAILPGWGDYRLNNSWYYAGFGIVAYGAVSGAILYNHIAANTYNNYKNSMDIAQSNKLFSDAKNQQKISNILAISSAAIWAIDLARVYIKSQKVKKEIKTSNYYFEQSNQTFSNKSNNFWFDNRTPFDIALEEGDKFFKSGSFNEAKLKYELAFKLEPINNIAQIKLNETNKILAEIKAKEDKYHNLVAKADSAFKVKDYVSAKTNYSEALNLIPNKAYPQQKLIEIAKIREKERKDKEYNEVIANANNSFNQKNYDEAKLLYQKSLTIYKNEPYPTNKIQECDNLIDENKYNANLTIANKFLNKREYDKARMYYNMASYLKPNQAFPKNKIVEINAILDKIEQAETDKEYKDYLTKADAAYNKKEYDKAKSFYQEASNIKPSETYPKNRINTINTYLEEKKIIVNTGDLTSIYKSCKPSVLFIFDVEYNYFKADYNPVPVGSGFFFTSDGYGVTNYHIYNVLKTNGIVYSGAGDVYEIEKSYQKDENLDYAIFKIKLDKYKKVDALTISKSGCKEGQKVCIIGNPNGLKFSIKDGIVSSFIDENTIEHSVPTEGGSSGSPLLNMNGEVIGLHTSGLRGKGNNNFATDIRKIPLYKYK